MFAIICGQEVTTTVSLRLNKIQSALNLKVFVLQTEVYKFYNNLFYDIKNVYRKIATKVVGKAIVKVLKDLKFTLIKAEASINKPLDEKNCLVKAKIIFLVLDSCFCATH